MRHNLGSFVEALERAGELVRVRVPVSPVLEIGAIADRISKALAPHPPSASAVRNDPRFFDRGGPALLFEDVEDSDIPVLINAYGSYRRMEMALGVEGEGFEAISDRIAALVEPELPRSLGEAFARLRELAPLLRITPRTIRKAPCQEIVETGEQVDLTRLPLLRCWPMDGDVAGVGYPDGINDGIPGIGHPAIDDARWERGFRGRYVTLGGVHTIHADDAGRDRPRSHNIGMYRVQLLGKRTMAMHWHMHHDGAAHWRSWKRRGSPMPVAIALGGETVLPYGATCPLPPGLSELLMAGFLHGRGIELVQCRTVPLRVPASAEIVIEGFVSEQAGPPGFDPRTGEDLGPGAALEGPFGDHTGFYSLPDRYPVLTVTAVTRRRRCIYPTTIVGLPIQEDYFLGKATERIFLPLLRVLIPDIIDYDLPMFGAFHNCVFVKIRKSYPMHARRVMHAIWGAGQMAWTKMVVVVDADVDVHDHAQVLRAIGERCRPACDLERVLGPLDILDHAAPRLGAGGKIGFDATRAMEGETLSAAPSPAPPRSGTNERARLDVLERVRCLAGVRDAHAPEACNGWLFISCNTDGRAVAQALGTLEPCAPFVVLVGPEVRTDDFDSALFHLCANWDPARDTIDCRAGVIFDATPKSPDGTGSRTGGLPVRDWPPVVGVDPATRDRVRSRWKAYGLSAFDQGEGWALGGW